MLHYELSEKIIGAAMRVLNELKPGLDEKIYENALLNSEALKMPSPKSNAVFEKPSKNLPRRSNIF